MKCPHCEQPLPPTHVPATCPACGARLTGLTDSNSETSDVSTVAMAVLKYLCWVLVVVLGCVMLLVSIAFAGCVCGGIK